MVDIALAETDEDVDRALALAERVWGAAPVSRPIARALSFAGWYVSTAHLDGALVGMCAGMVGLHGRDRHLHSHLAAVAPGMQGRGIGRALKRHQRAWCLDHDIGVVSWTFDPLVRENARFNLHHLGAVGARYLVDLYGPMDDDINRGQPSDRLLCHWELESDRAVAALEAPLPEAEPDDRTRIATPPDIASLRWNDPDEALRWRLQVRDAMLAAFDAGLRPVALDSDHHYVLAPEAP